MRRASTGVPAPVQVKEAATARSSDLTTTAGAAAVDDDSSHNKQHMRRPSVAAPIDMVSASSLSPTSNPTGGYDHHYSENETGSTKNSQVHWNNKDGVHPTNPQQQQKKSRWLDDQKLLWQRARQQCGQCLNHSYTQLLIVALIAVNALMMGIETCDFVKNDPATAHAFNLTDTIFLTIFTVELGMQFCYRGWSLLKDPWLVFDLIIIVISWSFSELQIIRAFRVFRALRLITRIRVMQNLVLGELRFSLYYIEVERVDR
jgi:Ion transport protein